MTIVGADRTKRMTPLVALGLLVAGSTLGAQNQPLPNQESFLIETRRHLQSDSTRQSNYVYVETRRALKLDKGGRTREESVKVVESYPGLPGEERWERLIAEDGRPVPPEELAREDRERQQKANEMVQRLARDSSKELARQERALEKARRERDEAVGDIDNVFEVRMIGRERGRRARHDRILTDAQARYETKDPRGRTDAALQRARLGQRERSRVGETGGRGDRQPEAGPGWAGQAAQGCPTVVPAPKGQWRALAACRCQL